jgi:hypothetical protein
MSAAAAALLVTLGTTGCVVPGDGYEGGDVGVSYGVNYYEPYDNNGLWGPGYLVGPPRGDRERSPHDDGARGHAWHAEPGGGHPMPSLPHGRPSGGGGGGGGHEGGHDGRH